MRCAALCLLLGCACFAATTHAAPQRGFPTFCGRELIDLKTLTDPRRKLVDFRPRATTVGAINARPMPRPTPRVRTAGFERQLWEVVAEITEYRLLPNGDLELILFDKGSYMNAAMPSPVCLSSHALQRGSMIQTRQFFEGRCGAATGQWRSLGAVAYVDGIGLWAVPHAQKGHARNYAELHPVTGMRFVSGCA